MERALECRRGDFRHCRNALISGISYDGGYQEYMLAPIEALASIPDSLSDVEAAPLLCAGITTFNSLRHSGALPSDLVAIQGIGGLGHLGIQFAAKFGYKVAAIGRGPENAALAKKLGAHVYIDSKATKRRRRAAKTRRRTRSSSPPPPAPKPCPSSSTASAPTASSWSSAPPSTPSKSPPSSSSPAASTIQGWASGTPTDSEDTLRFAELTGVRSMIETYPLEKAAEAYARMLSGHAQFRVVLTM